MTISLAVDEPAAAEVIPVAPDVATSHNGAWRKLGLCIALMAVLNIASKVGLAVALPLQLPAWVVLLINPMPMFMASSASHDALWVYLLVGTLRLGLADPLSYCIGRYGAEAVAEGRRQAVRNDFWLQRPIRAVQRWIHPLTSHLRRPSAWMRQKLTERFHRIGYGLVFLHPVNWVLILAGGFRLRVGYVIAADLIGTVAWLLLIGFLGEHMSHWLLLLFTF